MTCEDGDQHGTDPSLGLFLKTHKTLIVLSENLPDQYHMICCLSTLMFFLYPSPLSTLVANIAKKKKKSTYYNID